MSCFHRFTFCKLLGFLTIGLLALSTSHAQTFSVEGSIGLSELNFNQTFNSSGLRLNPYKRGMTSRLAFQAQLFNNKLIKPSCGIMLNNIGYQTIKLHNVPDFIDGIRTDGIKHQLNYVAIQLSTGLLYQFFSDKMGVQLNAYPGIIGYSLIRTTFYDGNEEVHKTRDGEFASSRRMLIGLGSRLDFAPFNHPSFAPMSFFVSAENHYVTRRKRSHHSPVYNQLLAGVSWHFNSDSQRKP